MKTNKELTEKCKAFGRSTFLKLGNWAAGNSSDDKPGNTGVAPFSFLGLWPEERPMPKRRSK